jgi:hypothetical protein
MIKQLITKAGSVAFLPKIGIQGRPIVTSILTSILTLASTDFFQTTNTILSGEVSVDDGVKAMESKIKRDLH